MPDKKRGGRRREVRACLASRASGARRYVDTARDAKSDEALSAASESLGTWFPTVEEDIEDPPGRANLDHAAPRAEIDQQPSVLATSERSRTLTQPPHAQQKTLDTRTRTHSKYQPYTAWQPIGSHPTRDCPPPVGVTPRDELTARNGS